MREKIFEEYRSLFDTLEVEGQNAEGLKTIVDAAGIVVIASNFARKDGLLALEEYVQNLDESNKVVRFFKEIMLLIVDGTEPELVAELGLYKLISFQLKDMEKLAGIMCLIGGLAIQQGENPRVMEEKIDALIPLEWKEDFEAERQKAVMECANAGFDHKKQEKTFAEKLADIEKEKSTITPEMDGFSIVRQLEKIVANLDDKALQVLLRQVRNADLGVAMKGMDGHSVSRILRNLSEQLAMMILEDMEFMGPIRTKDIVEANRTILDLAEKLRDSMEFGQK